MSARQTGRTNPATSALRKRRAKSPTLLLPALDTGVAGGEFVLELFNPTRSIDELQFAGIERMANIANIDLQFFAGAARDELVPATATHLRLKILWMDAVFRGIASLEARRLPGSKQ
jgi:hypothetical protein